MWQSLDGTRRAEQTECGYVIYLRGARVGLTTWEGMNAWLNGRMPELLPEETVIDSLELEHPMNCYIVCNNDHTECVVIGTEAEAEAKRLECEQHDALRNPPGPYGARAYWHLHCVTLHDYRAPHPTASQGSK